MSSEAEDWKSEPASEHELGGLCRRGRSTVFRPFHYEGTVIDRAGEFQATFATARGYAYGRNRMFEVEHHEIFTR